MNELIEEIRLSRAFSRAFYNALLDDEISVPQEVLDKFVKLKEYNDYQMSKELS
jgi:hypothetical protein